MSHLLSERDILGGSAETWLNFGLYVTMIQRNTTQKLCAINKFEGNIVSFGFYSPILEAQDWGRVLKPLYINRSFVLLVSTFLTRGPTL